MNLIEDMKAAAGHLQQATKLAHDWRVRNAVADAATMIQCAVFIQEKIVAGRMMIEPHPPNCPVPRHD
jgi:hypothetical protein